MPPNILISLKSCSSIERFKFLFTSCVSSVLTSTTATGYVGIFINVDNQTAHVPYPHIHTHRRQALISCTSREYVLRPEKISPYGLYFFQKILSISSCCFFLPHFCYLLGLDIKKLNILIRHFDTPDISYENSFLLMISLFRFP